jgi:hypothetical protein
MAEPNIVNVTTIYARTIGTQLTTNNMTTVFNNPAGSGKVSKINTLNASNFSNATVTLTVSYYTAANVGGTGFRILGEVTIPAYSTLNVIDKGTQYYIEEDRSLGSQASTANSVVITASYEDIS